MMTLKNEKESILLVTAIPPTPCKSPIGDFVHIQSIKNKLQYSQMKTFSFHFNMFEVDPLLKALWNKIALLLYILENNLNYDWIIWMDVDALILDMDFDIPFQDYSQYDLVLYGDNHKLYNETDTLLGLNNGVLFIRNSQWSRNFIKKACDLGKHGEEIMKSTLKNYRKHLLDQNAFGTLLYQEKALRSRVFFERRFQINGYWEAAKKIQGWHPFIIHFAGCEFCDGIYGNDRKDCFPLWKTYVQNSTARFSKGLV
jgi:xyloglucan 6-xylosyltransferase